MAAARTMAAPTEATRSAATEAPAAETMAAATVAARSAATVAATAKTTNASAESRRGLKRLPRLRARGRLKVSHGALPRGTAVALVALRPGTIALRAGARTVSVLAAAGL